MTAEVRITDLFERFVWRNVGGKVVICVLDLISPSKSGEVAAEQLKSAEIQEITEPSRAIFMKLARNAAPLQRGLAMIAGRTNRLQ